MLMKLLFVEIGTSDFDLCWGRGGREREEDCRSRNMEYSRICEDMKFAHNLFWSSLTNACNGFAYFPDKASYHCIVSL